MKPMRLQTKKAQTTTLPFSVIFSLFLIIVFLVVAFYVIKHFMKIKCEAKFGLFIDELRDEIDRTWASQSGDFVFEKELSDRIQYVCFANLSEPSTREVLDDKGRNVFEELRKNADYTSNLFFYPARYACLASTYVKHVKFENPTCIKVEQGVVRIKITKGFYDSLVRVAEPE